VSGCSAVFPRPGRVRLLRRRGTREGPASDTCCDAKNVARTLQSERPKPADIGASFHVESTLRNAATRFGWTPQPCGSVPCRGDILHAAARGRHVTHLPSPSGCASGCSAPSAASGTRPGARRCRSLEPRGQVQALAAARTARGLASRALALATPMWFCQAQQAADVLCRAGQRAVRLHAYPAGQGLRDNQLGGGSSGRASVGAAQM